MRTALALVSVPLFLQVASAIPGNNPVCIVGAGPAGLSAANQLEKKGYKTILFDKEVEVGGKCQAYYENGIFHPLGAVLFSNASYPETVKIVNSAGIPSAPFPVVGGRDRWDYNWTTGQTFPDPGLPADFVQTLRAEIPRYTVLWQQVFQPLSVTPGYKTGVPANLTVSTTEWMAQNGFQALPVLMVNPMALYGYGDVRVVPILYTLQYMTPDLVLMFSGQHPAYIVDYHAVWTNFAKSSIKGTIKTDTKVTCIDRTGSQPVVHYQRKESLSPEEQKCSDVIMAFPPTISALNAAGINLDPAEEEVFNAVGVHNYFSAAVKLNVPANATFQALSESPAVPPENAGEPVLFLRLNPLSQIATSWSWGPYRQFESKAEAKQLLKSTLSKVNKDPNNASAISVPVTDQDVRAFRKWDYFPHFDSAQLRDGWYSKFNKLQGVKHTYWASGLNGFETVEWAIRAGLDIADSYF